MKRYQAGDEVWWAHYGMESVRVECPICFGKMKVTLILGNGDHCEVLCDYCGKGFDGPMGYITEYRYQGGAELVTINEVRIRSSLTDPDVFEYYTAHIGHFRQLEPDDIFDTKEEALARSFLKSQEKAVNDVTMAERLKKDAKKSFTWNAGYHLRAAKKARQDAEYHELRAIICKSRSKSEPK